MNDKPVSYVTALDLADMMQEYGESGFQYPFCMELKYVAVMLRQQQNEIEALKSKIHDAMSWIDVKEWNSVDREILLEIFQGKAQEK